VSGFVPENHQARFAIAALDLQHLCGLEPGQPRVRQVERDRDARHVIGGEPFVREPIVGPEGQPARLELDADLGDALFDLGAFNRDAEIAQPDLQQLLVWPRRPLRVRH
jgi:hypothetical protein